MTENTANIGFEKEIWDAACILRGNMDAAEYKQVVLGLIFLKYISDKFEARYNELMAEDPDFAEDKIGTNTPPAMCSSFRRKHVGQRLQTRLIRLKSAEPLTMR